MNWKQKIKLPVLCNKSINRKNIFIINWCPSFAAQQMLLVLVTIRMPTHAHT